ncbi:pyruvate kinase [Haematococcus lacustris]
MNVARFNFSHGDHTAHQEVLDRLRKVAGQRQRRVACLLDTKGPEIRTAMVRDGKPIDLVAGQEVTLVAVGDQYTSWEGGLNPETGEVRIGVSYAKLCRSMSPGKRILISDGSLVIEVLRIVSDTELVGRCLCAKQLGPRKNVNLPGVKVDIPVLTPKDIEDLQQFCCRNKMDFVAASFVQTGDDVRFIRQVLDSAGGEAVKIISKIENESGLEHYDDILAESDGIMVARGDLAMEIPSEKVALAQKLMITKANIAGKFVITATQMLESMVSNPLPTRAEMTDVANAVFDGTDAVMLSGETANGSFPDTAVRTMAAIVANAENASGYTATQCFIRDHSRKPITRIEAAGCIAASSMVDCNAQLVVCISESGEAARLVAKYRPAVPQIIITTCNRVANQACIVFGQYAIKVPSMLPSIDDLLRTAREHADREGLWLGEGLAVVLHGHLEACADITPVMRLVDLGSLEAAESLARPADSPLKSPMNRLSLRV